MTFRYHFSPLGVAIHTCDTIVTMTGNAYMALKSASVRLSDMDVHIKEHTIGIALATAVYSDGGS